MEYILKLDYVTLMMMQADVSRYVDKPKMTPQEIARHFEELDRQRKGTGETPRPAGKGVAPMDFFTNYAAK